MWLAGALLLAHSIFPHAHHGEAHEVIVQTEDEPTGIVDLLSELFHNDLGAEHLEHFQVQKNQAPSLNAIHIEVTPPVIVTEEFTEVEYSPFLETPPFDEPILIGYGLRGPPLV